MSYKTYRDWFKEIIWLKNKVILPSNIRINKLNYQNSKGFDIDKFNSMLFQEYNKQYPVSDGRRYKK